MILQPALPRSFVEFLGRNSELRISASANVININSKFLAVVQNFLSDENLYGTYHMGRVGKYMHNL